MRSLFSTATRRPSDLTRPLRFRVALDAASRSRLLLGHGLGRFDGSFIPALRWRTLTRRIDELLEPGLPGIPSGLSHALGRHNTLVEAPPILGAIGERRDRADYSVRSAPAVSSARPTRGRLKSRSPSSLRRRLFRRRGTDVPVVEREAKGIHRLWPGAAHHAPSCDEVCTCSRRERFIQSSCRRRVLDAVSRRSSCASWGAEEFQTPCGPSAARSGCRSDVVGATGTPLVSTAFSTAVSG